MTDRDRLIELIEKSFAEQYEKRGLLTAPHTADDLLANGVIVPPAEVGQTVYCVDDYLKVVEECKVYGFSVVNGKKQVFVDNGECKFVTSNWHSTKEEAEEKLKELKDNA